MTEHASSHPQEELRTLKKSNRILKKKAVLHERENSRFSKSLKQKAKELEQKDKELEQKDKELNFERSLWNSRKAGWDSGAGTDLHRIEVFDGIISNESNLHSATLQNIKEFQYILRHVEAYVTASGEMPLFYDDESRASDPGNRCKLRLRHALLMALIRKKDNPAQGTLQALFGVDQTSVCRYLHVMDGILAVVLPTAENASKDIAECKTREEFKKRVPTAVLPTAENASKDIAECETREEFKKRVPTAVLPTAENASKDIAECETREEFKKRVPTAVLPTAENASKDIAECETREEFKKMVPTAVLPTAENASKDIAECKTKEEFKKSVPGPDVGDVFVDGTHCRVQRPSEKTLRRMRYSGKKKTFTNNTNVYTNAGGIIIWISKRSVGSTGDIMLLREDPMPFGKWAESMREDSTPKEDRIRIWADRGYQGTGKDLPGATLMIPYKRSKKHRILTVEQKAHNHLVNSTRVLVEHYIGRIKRYARVTDPYDGTIGEFNRELNVITGLVNLHLLWDKIDKGPPSPERWGTRIDWNGPVPPTSGTPF